MNDALLVYSSILEIVIMLLQKVMSFVDFLMDKLTVLTKKECLTI